MMASAPVGDDGNSFVERLNATRDTFKARMDDDFNAPLAIAVLQELTREVNTLLNSEATVGQNTLAAIEALYNELGGEVLGIVPKADAAGADAAREAGLIELLIDLRKRARKEKNYAESDRIRDELARLGVGLEDRADGTVWRVN
jgi:cysteinyl-tRNA synthetase